MPAESWGAASSPTRRAFSLGFLLVFSLGVCPRRRVVSSSSLLVVLVVLGVVLHEVVLVPLGL